MIGLLPISAGARLQSASQVAVVQLAAARGLSPAPTPPPSPFRPNVAPTSSASGGSVSAPPSPFRPNVAPTSPSSAPPSVAIAPPPLPSVSPSSYASAGVDYPGSDSSPPRAAISPTAAPYSAPTSERATVGASVTVPDWAMIAGGVALAALAYVLLRKRGHV